ncbi:MAG: multidrug transporter [Acidobacteria bacterium]|nr:multidrug transporter [Acidobacteriota bacterium]
MHSGRNYSFREVVAWTRRETFVFLVIAAIPTFLYEVMGWKLMAMPWLPVALIGTAVAFLTGFKNSAAYSRLWEARQVWGSILNESRTFTMLVLDSCPDQEVRRRVLYRHLAWITALRYQLREPRSWERMAKSHNREFLQRYSVEEWDGKLRERLEKLLSAEDLDYVWSKRNRATNILALQSRAFREMAAKDMFDEFRHIELQHSMASFVDAQGRCERLKNFPYPRQFATLNYFFAWMFIICVPFGMLQEFAKMGNGLVWLTIPASVVVSWVFHTMDKIGDSSENPFEGSPNDVPITAISRTIEVDVREMLDESEIPPALQPVHDILM